MQFTAASVRTCAAPMVASAGRRASPATREAQCGRGGGLRALGLGATARLACTGRAAVTVRASGKGFGDKKTAEPAAPAAASKQVPFQLDMAQVEAMNNQMPPAPELSTQPTAEGSGEPTVQAASPDRIELNITEQEIRNLDISQVRAALEPRLARGAEGVAELLKLTVGFELNWTKELGDPREKCEIPDIRLWFLRLDAEYPWLPVALDWRAGELARYAAMLVPHQITAKDGLVFNPEGIELFVNGKLFVTYRWLCNVGGIKTPKTKVQDMMLMLGYNIEEDELFNLI